MIATAASASRITLTWQEVLKPNGLPISNYQIYEGTVPGVYSKIGVTTNLTYNSTGLSGGTTYYFYIVAVDSGYDSSAPSDPVSATTPGTPPKPSDLQATTPAATKISLSWQWSPGRNGLPVGHYNVNCGTSSSNQQRVGMSINPSYPYTGLAASSQYVCNVQAVDTANDVSTPSSNLTIVTPPMPSAPTNVTATASHATTVTVTWSETVPPRGLPIASYSIYRNTSLPVTSANYLATRTSPTITDTTASASTTYYYAIVANDSGQDASAMSAPAKVTTPAK